MSPFVTTCPCRLAFVQNIPDLTAAFPLPVNFDDKSLGCETITRTIKHGDGNVTSEQESAQIVWTLLYFDFRCWRCCSPHTLMG